MSARKHITRYNGGKNASGVYQTIINRIPPHDVYYEPFLGSGAIFRRKKRSLTSILVDKDPSVIDKWGHLSDSNKLTDLLFDTKEITFNGGVVRLGDALVLLKHFPPEHDNRHTFIYLDPPYPMHTRHYQGSLYKCEFDLQEHADLLALACTLKCNVMISTYRNDLYDKKLKRWIRFDYPSQTRHGARIESIYMNYDEPKALHDYSYIGKDYRERERIKKKVKRWIRRLDDMPLLERKAVTSAILERAS